MPVFKKCFIITDQLLVRDAVVDHVELLIPLFEEVVLFTYAHQLGLQGLVEQCSIRSTAISKIKNLNLNKVALHSLWFAPSLKAMVAQTLKTSTDASLVPVITLTKGLIPRFTFSSETKHFYYLFSFPMLNSGAWWQGFQARLLQKRLRESLKNVSTKFYLSSQFLVQKLGNPQQAKVLPPFFKSEDFPRIEMHAKRSDIVVDLTDLDRSGWSMLWKLVHQRADLTWHFLGKLPLSLAEINQLNWPPHCSWKEEFCAATLQAVLLSSCCFISFARNFFPFICLAALASGVPVLVPADPIIEEFIPQGLRFTFHGVQDLENQLFFVMDSSTLPKDEMRRYALKYQEKFFKDRWVHILKQSAQTLT